MTPGREFYLWQVQSFTVRIDLNLVDSLNRTLADPRLKADEERGGILLGRRTGPTEIEITDFELVSSQHRRGAIYDLGLREQAAFAKRTAGLSRNSTRQPVGFFRTHLRRGLYLVQDDFALMTEAFADPANIALLIRPLEPGPSNAGIFLWEDGDIDRRQSKLVFPFDSATLRVQGPVESGEMPAVVVTKQPARSPIRILAIPLRWIAWGAIAAARALVLSAALPHLHTPRKPESVAAVPPKAAAEPPVIEPIAEPAAVQEELPKPDEGASTPEAAPRAFTPQRISVFRPAPRPSAVFPSIPEAPLPAVAVKKQPSPSVQVAVSVEAKESSELKRIVSHVPLFGRSFHAEGGSNFTPARPSAALQPRIPQDLASDLSGDIAIDVLLSIDKRGSVTNTQVLHGAGTQFASFAAASAGSAISGSPRARETGAWPATLSCTTASDRNKTRPVERVPVPRVLHHRKHTGSQRRRRFLSFA
jgi:hypothetical protein